MAKRPQKKTRKNVKKVAEQRSVSAEQVEAKLEALRKKLKEIEQETIIQNGCIVVAQEENVRMQQRLKYREMDSKKKEKSSIKSMRESGLSKK